MENLGNLSIENIVTDISSVLSKHLTNVSSAVKKFKEEKRDIETILLGIPYVKNLKQNYEKLVQENEKLKNELAKFNTCEEKFENDIEENVDEKIKLEVLEKELSNGVISEEMIVQEIENDLELKRKQQIEEMEKKLSLNAFHLMGGDDEDDMQSFSDNDDDDDGDDDEDDGDDDDNENNPIIAQYLSLSNKETKSAEEERDAGTEVYFSLIKMVLYNIN